VRAMTEFNPDELGLLDAVLGNEIDALEACLDCAIEEDPVNDVDDFLELVADLHEKINTFQVLRVKVNNLRGASG
jgi:hypothetical protein